MDQEENITRILDDVQGDILGPPHGTTPAAVIANKKNCDPLGAVSIFVEKRGC